MKITLIIFFSFISISLGAQEIKTLFIGKIALETERFVGIDEFQHLYYINDNILYKKTKDKVFSYSNISLGNISMVNIQNPFKLILFYADFNAVMILDNNLNELSQQIDFTRETLFNNVKFVSGSSQNNIWLYADDHKLHLYNYQNLSEQVQTQATTFYENDFNPKTIISTYKNVWILADSGVLEFNEYGIFIKSVEDKGIERIFPYQKGYIFYKNASWYYQNQSEVVPVNLEHEHLIRGMSVNSSNIFIYDGEFVYQYQLKT